MYKMLLKLSSQVIAIIFIVSTVNISLTNSLKRKNGKCTQTNACKCTFPDGYFYDISELREVHFGWLKLDDSSDLFYTPCKDSLIVDSSEANACNRGAGVTLCLRNNATHEYSGFGSSIAEFESKDESDGVSLKFQVDKKRITINLVCDGAVSQPDLRLVSSSKANEEAVVVSLVSSEACLKSTYALPDEEAPMSVGAKLIFISLVLFGAYFGGGVLALKYIRGAEGFEMIPNYEFWVDLPYLVRDGVLFLTSGCQVSPSYDRI